MSLLGDNTLPLPVELKYPTNSFNMDVNAGTVTVTNQPYQP